MWRALLKVLRSEHAETLKAVLAANEGLAGLPPVPFGALQQAADASITVGNMWDWVDSGFLALSGSGAASVDLHVADPDHLIVFAHISDLMWAASHLAEGRGELHQG